MGMNDLNELLRTRFKDHEVPVDPGAWTAIQAGLQAPVVTEPGSDPVVELFRTRFEGHEADVAPDGWTQIQGRLGRSGGGPTNWAGWAAAAAGVVLLSAGIWWILQGPSQVPPEVATVTEPALVQVPSIETPPADPPENIAAPTVIELERAEPQVEPAVVPEAMDTTGPARPGPLETTTQSPVLETRSLPRAALSSGPPVDSSALRAAQEGSGKALVEQVLNDLTAKAEAEVRRAAHTTPTTQQTAPEDLRSEPMNGEPDVAPMPQLYLPSTFTPNGDGVNDTYRVVGQDFQHIRVRVHSIRTNQQVFATNAGEEWDGTNCADGHYVVAVEAITHDGRVLTQSKVVWLYRTTQ